jgi:hypothetical protein
MTVKHLQNVQRQQLAVAVATDPAVLHKFKTGFSECATEVSRYIGRLEGVDQTVRQRLVAHLSSCVSGLQQLSPYSFMPSSTQPVVPSPIAPPAVPAAHPQVPFPTGDVNNNHGLSRLPNDITCSSNQQPFFPPIPSATVTSGAIDRSRPSAFTAVTRSTSPRPQAAPSPGVSSSSDESCSDTPGRRVTNTEVQLQLKTMPVPRLTSSVGTSTSPPPSRHALDFSMKPPPPRKRSLEEDGAPDRKIPRFSVHVSTLPPPQQPSVLAGSSRHPQTGGHDSMWRPW